MIGRERKREGEWGKMLTYVNLDNGHTIFVTFLYI